MQQKKTLLFCGEKADVNFMRQLQEYFDVIECKEKLYENFIKNQPSVVVTDTKDNLIFEDVKEIKKISEIAVVVYTDNEDIVHKLVCFELGVDEYILKKWDEREVLARIKAVCARSFKKRKKDEVLVFEGLMINKTSYEVQENGKSIEFPPKEFELLYTLAETAGKVFTREQLLDRIWGFDYYGDTRTVDVHIDRIRKKLDKEVIKTVYGVGYKFDIS